MVQFNLQFCKRHFCLPPPLSVVNIQSRMKMQGHLSLGSDHTVAVQRQIKNNGAVLLCRQKKPSTLLYLQVYIIYHVSEDKFVAMLSS